VVVAAFRFSSWGGDHGLMGELHVGPRAAHASWDVSMDSCRLHWIFSIIFSNFSIKTNQFNFFNKLNFYFAIHGAKGCTPIARHLR
jgi:hypothetical protein